MTRVFFVTLSRSDYATLRPIALAAQEDTALDTVLVAGGSHLLSRFGHTIDSIRADGLSDIRIVDFLREDDDSDDDIAAAYARAVSGFIELLRANKPDFVFIVGDRWEMIAVATVASMLRIPVAHHSGGDITQGSADNQTRYVLTTLSHLHFVALDDHKKRLIHMGEEESRVTVVGEPALIGLRDVAAKVPDIRAELGLKADAPFVLATFHPTSYDALPPQGQIEIFLKALDMVADDIVLTAPNPDPSSGSFYEIMSSYARRHPRVHMFENLGRDRYYAAMASARFMIGNSSSGLWEAPSFRLPVVNIGNRQKGRLHGRNIVHAELNADSIQSAVVQVTQDSFRDALSDSDNPYVREDGVDIMLSVLKRPYSRDELLAKVFVDPLETTKA